MDKNAAARRIEVLRSEITEHDYHYYVRQSPVISDAEYDELMRELLAIEGEFPDLVTPDSPTQRVGGRVQEGFRPFTHRMPMTSIDNITGPEEAREFDARIKRALGIADADTPIEYIAEPKFDGVSASLTYTHGRLETAATRGDGRTGEDVTMGIRTIRSIPLHLRERGPLPASIEVRGEVIIPIEEFKRFNDKLAGEGEPIFASPRNSASGALRQLDPERVAERPLSFYAWGIGSADGLELALETEVMEWINGCGFIVEKSIKRCADIEDAISYQAELEAMRDTLPYEIDGVVLKINDRALQAELGSTARSPRWAVAFKFKPREATTVLERIEVQVGRMGLLTPVAHLTPVKIGGVTVKRANLHTFDVIRQKDIREGDTVLVKRAGDVIPDVMGPIVEKRTGSEAEFTMPTSCPVCGTTIERDNAYHYCPNLSCPAQLRGRIKHLASRRAFDIRGLGEKVIVQLLRSGLINDFADVFDLTKDDLLPLERFAEVSAAKLEGGIKEAKRVSFARLINALSIRNVGETVAEVLAAALPSLAGLMAADEETLTSIPTIGPEIASSVRSFFALDTNRKNIEKMLHSGVRIEYPAAARPRGGSLEGKTFVLTGTLAGLTRTEAKGLIAARGGRVTTGVTSKTDYVVAGESPGSKAARATELGIETIDEAGLKRLLDM